MEIHTMMSKVTYQSIIYITVGFVMFTLAFFVMVTYGAPYARAMLTFFIGMTATVSGAYTVNCVMVGGCFVWSWMMTFVGLLSIFSIVIGGLWKRVAYGNR